MRKALKRVHFIQEAFLIALLIALINNYFGEKEVVILADGKGYYDYLPALVIYQDLNFNFIDTLVTDYYNHADFNQGINPVINDKKIDKYFAGTALVQLPFFLVAHLTAITFDQFQADGYSLIYQRFVSIAALFYLFLGLYWLRKILQLQFIAPLWIFVLQLMVLFCSSLMHYAHADASFSHIYSFAFVNLFIYSILKFKDGHQVKFIYLTAIALGIIGLIRPVNVLIVLFIPFLFDSFRQFLSTIKYILYRNPFHLSFSLLVIFAIILIQPLIWYVQTGLWYLKPYQDEWFILTKPNLINFLFSYRKGFFIYAPAFFFLIISGALVYLIRRNYWKMIGFFAASFLTIYVLSSWWAWWYGSSFGSRVMIEYYGFFILFGSSLFTVKNALVKVFSALLVIPFAYLSILQTYQYQQHILHWSAMNKQRYWQVFLRTEEKFSGLFYSNYFDPGSKEVLFHKELAPPQLQDFTTHNSILIDSINLNDQIPDLYKVDKINIQLNLDINYREGIDQVLVALDDKYGNNLFYHQMHVFKGGGIDNYSGRASLNYSFDQSKTPESTLKLYYLYYEEGTSIDHAELHLYGW